MAIQFRLANQMDLELVISIQNQAYFEDYKRFGFCPGYNQDLEQIRFILDSAEGYYDYIIYEDELPVGNLMVKIRDKIECHLKSLCVITLRQSKGIGSLALQFLEQKFKDCEKITLETYAEKLENLYFYQKNGYQKINRIEYKGIWCAIFEKRIQ